MSNRKIIMCAIGALLLGVIAVWTLSAEQQAVIVGHKQQTAWCIERGFETPQAMEFHLVWELYTNRGQGMREDITLDEVREKARDFMYGMGYPKETQLNGDHVPLIPLPPRPQQRSTAHTATEDETQGNNIFNSP